MPTLDAPELGYIKESTSEQYVPDVFYKVRLNTVFTFNNAIIFLFFQTKGEYGADETFLARPFPLYQLTVDLTTTTPLSPQPLFPGGKGRFPVENREMQVGNEILIINHDGCYHLSGCILSSRSLVLSRTTSVGNMASISSATCPTFIYCTTSTLPPQPGLTSR